MAGEFNFISLSYLFARLAPFIIICYFALQSLFNWDFKGIFYLAGVLFTVFLNIICLNLISPDTNPTSPVCTAIEGMPNSPIGQSILGFTFAYLSYATFPIYFYRSGVWCFMGSFNIYSR